MPKRIDYYRRWLYEYVKRKEKVKWVKQDLSKGKYIL